MLIARSKSKSLQNRTNKNSGPSQVTINGITTTIPPGLNPDEEALLDALQEPNPRH